MRSVVTMTIEVSLRYRSTRATVCVGRDVFRDASLKYSDPDLIAFRSHTGTFPIAVRALSKHEDAPIGPEATVV